ncbi:hypothetical protein V6N13_134897 [Hibiscus sabdariffa]
MAEERAEVVEGEEVGGVDVAVAQKTEVGGVSWAEEKGRLVVAEIAGQGGKQSVFRDEDKNFAGDVGNESLEGLLMEMKIEEIRVLRRYANGDESEAITIRRNVADGTLQESLQKLARNRKWECCKGGASADLEYED